MSKYLHEFQLKCNIKHKKMNLLHKIIAKKEKILLGQVFLKLYQNNKLHLKNQNSKCL